MEELLVTDPTLPRGGPHDEGGPSDEELWGVAATSPDPTGAGAEVVGDAPSNATWDPPMIVEQTTAPVVSIVEARLRQPI